MNRFSLSPYRIMWLFVMFDLPVGTRSERKQASRFRNDLLDLGFEMSQFSIYLKYCASGEKAEAVSSRIPPLLPPGGKVDVLCITDKQFSNMRRYHAKKPRKTDGAPRQLQIF